MGSGGDGYLGAISLLKEREQIHRGGGRLRHEVGGSRGLTGGRSNGGGRLLRSRDTACAWGSEQFNNQSEKFFVTRMMQGIPQVLQTNHRTTTAYQQQENGQLERLNHTFADMLSICVSADHLDWDSALSYVRFTNNTSRQKTTGWSPFFLIHGRHTVLPVDAIWGADPDPSQKVSVESGGPGNYEECMLGNLQKPFPEVDWKSQVAQERQSGTTTITTGKQSFTKKDSRCWYTGLHGRWAGRRSCCTGGMDPTWLSDRLQR